MPFTATSSSRETAALEPDAARHHPADEARELSRPAPVGQPANHWFFEGVRRHEVPETFVLELAGGSVLGRHAAVVTAAGRLDHETSHYFGTSGWREHPVFLDPRPRPAEHVEGTLLVLAARATGDNYYHFLIDALPRLGILEDALPGALTGVDAVLVDATSRYQRELADLLGLDRFRQLHPRRGLHLRADRLLVPSLPNTSTVVAPRTTQWLREALPPRTTTGLPERLYVTRGTTPHTRRVVREEELRERLVRRGFTVLDPGRLSVQEQIDHFAAARVVVAPHGAALTNLTFCRPACACWSFRRLPQRLLVDPQQHRGLGTATCGRREPRRSMRGVMHDIDIDPARRGGARRCSPDRGGGGRSGGLLQRRRTATPPVGRRRRWSRTQLDTTRLTRRGSSPVRRRSGSRRTTGSSRAYVATRSRRPSCSSWRAAACSAGTPRW